MANYIYLECNIYVYGKNNHTANRFDGNQYGAIRRMYNR